jgi:hypothetical protein
VSLLRWDFSVISTFLKGLIARIDNVAGAYSPGEALR